ncbi:MAG: hypothetical protein CMM93_02220 [Rickettsiales bacterium]|nr:hypothetical protein [Rickettsiales bacterium]|tara:strand:- start:254 stop:757 length:504 start_codon:yes stop_codon:yes gene_type:complete
MRYLLLLLAPLLILTACDDLDTEAVFPKRQELERVDERGKLTGDGLTIGGGDEEAASGGNNPLGVNSFLWRATLDTLAFMPLASADPFGGVIITDWYEDPKARGERFKINALILDRTLRSDGINVSVFKQVKRDDGWQDADTEEGLERKLEDTILTRARELRVRNAS